MARYFPDGFDVRVIEHARPVILIDEGPGAGLRVHTAIAVWVPQHCFAPADDIARIGR